MQPVGLRYQTFVHQLLVTRVIIQSVLDLYCGSQSKRVWKTYSNKACAVPHVNTFDHFAVNFLDEDSDSEDEQEKANGVSFSRDSLWRQFISTLCV